MKRSDLPELIQPYVNVVITAPGGFRAYTSGMPTVWQRAWSWFRHGMTWRRLS